MKDHAGSGHTPTMYKYMQRRRRCSWNRDISEAVIRQLDSSSRSAENINVTRFMVNQVPHFHSVCKMKLEGCFSALKVIMKEGILALDNNPLDDLLAVTVIPFCLWYYILTPVSGVSGWTKTCVSTSSQQAIKEIWPYHHSKRWQEMTMSKNIGDRAHSKWLRWVDEQGRWWTHWGHKFKKSLVFVCVQCELTHEGLLLWY